MRFFWLTPLLTALLSCQTFQRQKMTLLDEGHTTGWKMAGPGGFNVKDGIATAHGGMGLWYYEKESFTNFTLTLEFRMPGVEANSGVFVRFPDPGGDPWKPVKEGYEIQICGDKPSKNSTGAIYSFKAPDEVPLKAPGEWNEFEITCVGQQYKVRLNGKLITTYTGDRSLKGFIGVQNHDDKSAVSFRNIHVIPLEGK